MPLKAWNFPKEGSGMPQQERKDEMKKLEAIIFTIVILSGLILLAGCSGTGYPGFKLTPVDYAIDPPDLDPSSRKPPQKAPLEITVELLPNVNYKPHRIPVKVVFTNKLSTEQDLLLITHKDRKSIESFSISCCEENGDVASCFAGLPTWNPESKVSNHVKLEPEGKYGIKLELSELLSPELKPGKYKLELEYTTGLGENSLENVIKAKSAVLEINGPDNIMKEGYISRKQALEIAKKENTIKYDWWGSIDVELDEGIYTVTFPIRLPKNSLGPDFASKIVIDAKTGEVISQIMGN